MDIKAMNRQFARDVDAKLDDQCHGNEVEESMKIETEALICAALEQALRISDMKCSIAISSTIGKCECPNVTRYEYEVQIM